MLKAERDELDSQVRQRAQAEEDWRSRHSDVEKQHAATKEQLSSVSTERDSLLQEKSALQSSMQEKESTVADLERKLADLAAQLSNGARQLQQVQAELKNANKRAEEAERIQGELQKEGVGLMRSLDEMRPKIVELTDAKLSLGEEIDSLKTAVRNRDATIAQLEANLDELRNEKEVIAQERQVIALSLEKERSASHASSSELQKESDTLQAELEASRAVVRNLEAERNNYHQMTERYLAELDQLKSSLQENMEQVVSLQNELDERQSAQQESQEFLEQAQNEMEALRAELSAKDQELEQLRVAASTPTPVSAQPNALDEEMLSAIKQQHALELSSAQSHIRTLETAVFEAEARAHALQKHVTALEDQLAHLRGAPSRSPMPRTSSRPVESGDELRRASFNKAAQQQHLAPTPTSATFEGLSAEAQHKRRVSLSMLKARIDSEVAASAKLASPTVRTAGLPTVVEPGSPQEAAAMQQQHAVPRKPQFMDDSHIFWCHCCQGDLVIL